MKKHIGFLPEFFIAIFFCTVSVMINLYLVKSCSPTDIGQTLINYTERHTW